MGDISISVLVDVVGLVCYALALVVHVGIARRVWPAWRRDRLALARALCIASVFLAVFAGFVVAHITVRYVFVEWQFFVWTVLAAVTRVLYLLVGLLIWRALRGK